MGAHASSRLAEQIVVAANGDEVALGQLIAGRPTLLVFTRHFGCIGCTVQLDELAARLRDLERLDVQIIVIGNGQPQHIEPMLRRHGLQDRSITVVSDPRLAVYRAAGMRRSLWRTIGPRALALRLRAAGRGATGFSGSGDHWQQGGAVLLDPSGEQVYRYRSRAVGDVPDLSDVIDAAIAMQSHRIEGRV